MAKDKKMLLTILIAALLALLTTFIIIKKISQTPPKYPRANGKIAKSAL
mgnify:CR=1 FL=1